MTQGFVICIKFLSVMKFCHLTSQQQSLSEKLGTYSVQSSNPFIQNSMLIFIFVIINSFQTFLLCLEILQCPIFLSITNLQCKINRLSKRLSPTFQRLYTQFRFASECNNKTEVKSDSESSKNVEKVIFFAHIFHEKALP